MSFHVFGQQLIEPEKKIYQAPDGKLYFPKATPVYFSVGLNKTDTSALNQSALLSSNPVSFSKEGINVLGSPSAVDPQTKKIIWPKQDVVFEVYVDGHPPVTNVSFGGAKTLKKDGKIYIGGNVRITLTAKDEIAGVDKVLYSIDKSGYKEYTESIVLEESKEYSIKYYAYDHVGNKESLKQIDLVIDNTKPETSFKINGDTYEHVLAGNNTIVFSTADNLSGIAAIKIKVDEKPLLNFSGTIHCSALSQGEHKIEYYAEDNVGNREKPQVYSFYIDRTAPTILQDIIGKTFMSNGKEYSSGRAQLKLMALDNKAGVKAVYYSINNGKFKLYEKPVFLNAVKGRMSVKAYAVDKVNNKSQAAEEANEQRLPYVDLTGPFMHNRFLGPIFVANDTTYISKITKIQFNGIDNESGLYNIQYAIDNHENSLYKTPFSIEKEGPHTIDYVGTDNVDNTTTQNLKVVVDNTGPIIYTRFSETAKGSVNDNGVLRNVYPGYVCLFVAATDFVAGYDHMTYALNGSAERLFSGFITGFQNKNEIVINAYDKLGNKSSVSLSFNAGKAN
jgi:hypothetical protein